MHSSETVRVSVVVSDTTTVVIYNEFLTGLERINALFAAIDALRDHAARTAAEMMEKGTLAA